MAFQPVDPSYATPTIDLSARARRNLARHLPDPRAQREVGLMLGLLTTIDPSDPASPTLEVSPWDTDGGAAVGGPSPLPVPRPRAHV